MSNKQIVYGLEKYFNYIHDPIKETFVKHLINVQHHNEPDGPWALKELIAFDYENLPDDKRTDRLNIYTTICTQRNLNIEFTLLLLNYAFNRDNFCEVLLKLFVRGKEDLLVSIFSRTQMLSKMWIGETISKFKNKFDNVLLLGGWTTHHTLFFKGITVNNLVSVDIDTEINEDARLFNPNVVIDNSDALSIFDDQRNITINGKLQDFDLVINTSAEHMSLEWYDKIKPGTTVLIQSNNMNDPDHINKSAHLGEFLRKYPVTKTYYRGEFNFDSYSRFMVFGVK
jgi:hypothetical protein